MNYYSSSSSTKSKFCSFYMMMMMMMMMMMTVILGLVSSALSQPDMGYRSCFDKEKYTVNSAYERNLNNILSRITSNTQVDYGFYNISSGENPDRANAIAICRGDTTLAECKSCLMSCIQALAQPYNKEAIGGYDLCLVRYSPSSNIFGTYTDTPNLYSSSYLKVTNVPRFVSALGQLMGNLTRIASSGDRRGRKFATGEANLTNMEQIYGLAQCTPDLTEGDCFTCLSESLAHMRNISNETRGAYFLTPSCKTQYDMFPFYKPVVSLTPSTSLPPSTTMVQTNTTNSPGRKSALSIIVGSSVSAVIVAVLVGSCLFYKCRSKNSDRDHTIQLLNLDGQNFFDDYSSEGNHQAKSEEFPMIPLELITTATDNFSETNKLGKGGFGPVYKGILPDGKEIAVKRLSQTSGQGLVEFKNEITLIAKLQHRNLVRLLGCCLEAKEVLLIYEYMPNKSLDVFLFDATRSAEISWKQRIIIINGIARGLLYLHEDSRLRIIHRDLKTGNILLDNEMNPKISDFGMARIFGINQVEANTNRVMGTFGYIAPEYAMKGLFSVKSDVYSYGVLLLEIISGKRNRRAFVAEHGQNLLTYAWKLWCDGRALEMIDPTLAKTYTESEVLKCVQIGLLCAQDDPADRPTMSKVVVMLRSDDNTSLPQPAQPLFPAVRQVTKPSQFSVSSLNDLTVSSVLPR